MTPEAAHIIASSINNLGDHVWWAAKHLASAIFIAAIIRAFANK